MTKQIAETKLQHFTKIAKTSSDIVKAVLMAHRIGSLGASASVEINNDTHKIELMRFSNDTLSLKDHTVIYTNSDPDWEDAITTKYQYLDGMYMVEATVKQIGRELTEMEKQECPTSIELRALSEPEFYDSINWNGIIGDQIDTALEKYQQLTSK